MPPQPQIPFANVMAQPNWSNYSGTISGRSIPTWVSLQEGADASILRKHGQAVKTLLAHCFDHDHALRVVGSAWSFSSVIQPGSVALDPSSMTYRHAPAPDQVSASYAQRSAAGFVPMYFQGGTGISSINRRLGALGLALQTSGAGDGHRIGGCIATGTHGSALRVGALHDTVLALHLVVSPNQALLVQRGTDPAFTPALAAWLGQQTGIPTRDCADDTLFAAAQVSLGSLGVVFGVIVEAAPLYHLRIRRMQRRIDDAAVWHAMRTLDTRALHPDRADLPHHFSVILHPYPDAQRNMMFSTLMWKESAAGVAFRSPPPGIARTSSDTLGMVARLSQALTGTLTAPLAHAALQTQILEQLRGDHKVAEELLFPGEAFGPTTLPAGSGASTEIVVDHKHTEATVRCIQRVLRRRAAHGQFLLGCIAVRFVPQTRALLGMNKAPMNCFIELPSARNLDVVRIYKAIWSALDAEGLAFTCHWGQMGGFNSVRMRSYYGADFDAWSQARASLLQHEPKALEVFASALARRVGLA